MTLSIRARLLLCIVAVAVLLSAAWLLATNDLQSVRGAYVQTVNDIDALVYNISLRTKLVDDEETGFRGYLLTGRPEFLQPYQTAQRELPGLRGQATALSAAEPGALALEIAMSTRATAWEAWAKSVLRSSQGPRGSPAFLAEQRRGEALFDRFRAASTAALSFLNSRRQEHLQTSLASIDQLRIGILAILAAALAVLGVACWSIYRAVEGPLARLQLRAAAIGHGNLAAPVEDDGPIELRRLARAMEGMRRQLRSQQALAATVGPSVHLESVYARCADMIHVVAPVDRLDVATVVDLAGAPAIRIVCSRAGPDGPADSTAQVPRPIGDSLFACAFRARGPSVRRDLAAVGAADLHADERAAQKTGLRSVAVTPLLVDGEVIGAVQLWSKEPDYFTDERIEAIEAASTFVAAAIVNAGLFEQVQQTSRALRDSEEQFRTTVERAPIGIALRALDGRWLQVNRALCEILGYSEAELLARDSEDITHPDDRHSHLDAGRQLRDGAARSASFEKRYIHKGGATVWVRVHASLVHTAGADQPHFVVQIEDITLARQAAQAIEEHNALNLALMMERTAALNAIQASEHKFRTLIEMAPFGICIADERGYFEIVNDAYAAIYGFRPDDMEGRPLTIVGPETLHDAADTGQAAPDMGTESDVVDRLGRPLTVLVNSVALAAPDGRLMRAIFLVDITERKRIEQHFAHVAHHDSLTGLPNRVLFQDRVTQTLLAASGLRTGCALMLFDLNRFKEVNDTHGHAAGDRLLQAVATRIDQALRPTDTVARLGGDEFAVLLPNTDELGATRAAAKILAAILPPIDLVPQIVTVGASIGIALFPKHGEDPGTLLSHADAAMYQAKQDGGGYRMST